MYTPLKIISENSKTGISINFPIVGHCKPTSLCKKLCYARVGHMALPSNKKKQQFVSDYFKGNDILQAIIECRSHTTVRLNGSGDFLPEHVTNIVSLAQACPNTVFYGMTRKPEIAKILNNALENLKILLSIDIETPKGIWKDYPGKMTFGPRRFFDKVPKDSRIVVVFPYHFGGKVIKHVPVHKKDCPAVRHTKSGCLDCGRCWKW